MRFKIFYVLCFGREPFCLKKKEKKEKPCAGLEPATPRLKVYRLRANKAIGICKHNFLI